VRNVTLAIAIFVLVLGAGQAEATKSTVKTAIQSGSAALQAGAYQAAAQQFTKALETKKLDAKTTALTLLNRGLALQHMGQFVEAIADYDRALQQRRLTKQTRAVALYNRGLANRKLYRTTLALEDFTNALILNPKFAQAYNSRANVLRELGYYTTAIQDYDAAVKFKHPQMHIPLYGKALSHAAVRNLVAAKEALTHALALKPSYQPAKTLLTRITTVPKPDPSETQTMVAESPTDPETTGTVEGSTTVVVKNNLPWAPAPKEVLAATTPDNRQTEEVLVPDNETAERLIAKADADPSSENAPAEPGDVVAQPTAAPPEATAQNLAPSEADEDPGRKTRVQPDKALETVPGPGTDMYTATTPSGDAQPDDADDGQVRDRQLAALETPSVASDSEDEYLIQISAQTNPDVARKLWNKMASKHADILGKLTPHIIKVEIEGKGTIYRVRAGGFGNREAGSRLCSRLKRRRVSCYVTAVNR